MSPEGSIHFFCPPCRLKISEWPSHLFPAWSRNKRSESLLTGNTQGQFFCLPTSSCGAQNKNPWDQGEKPCTFSGKNAWVVIARWQSLTQRANNSWEWMHLGHQDEKHAMKGLLKLFFMLAVDLVGLILECFPWSVGCESRAPGEGFGWHAQAAPRYVFFFLSEFHTSAALLQKKAKIPPDMLVTGKLKGRCWEPAVQEHCDQHPHPHLTELWLITSTETAPGPLQDSTPAWKSTDCTPLLQQKPQLLGICLPSREVLPSVCFLWLIT